MHILATHVVSVLYPAHCVGEGAATVSKADLQPGEPEQRQLPGWRGDLTPHLWRTPPISRQQMAVAVSAGMPTSQGSQYLE